MKKNRSDLSRLFKALRKAGKMDLRVAQLFENIRQSYMNEWHRDLFYVENDGLSDMIEKYLERNRPVTHEQAQKEIKKYMGIIWKGKKNPYGPKPKNG